MHSRNTMSTGSDDWAHADAWLSTYKLAQP